MEPLPTYAQGTTYVSLMKAEDVKLALSDADDSCDELPSATSPACLGESPLDTNQDGYDSENQEIPLMELQSLAIEKVSWKKRWFVLKPTKLAYYKNEKEYELLRYIKVESIHSVQHVETKKRQFVFGIVTKERTFFFQAFSEEEEKEWINLIRLAVKQNVAEPNLSDTLRSSLFGSSRGAVPREIAAMQREESTLSESATNAIQSALMNSAGINSILMSSTMTSGILSSSDSLGSFDSPMSLATSAPSGTHFLRAGPPPSLGKIAETSGPIPVQHDMAPRMNFATSLPNPILLPTPKSAGPRVDSSSKVVKFSEAVISPDVESRLNDVSDTSSEEGDHEAANLSITDNRVVRHGYVQKLTKFSKSWKKRWFVLRNGCLTWYKDEREYEARRIIDLRKVLDILEIDPLGKTHQFCFKVVLHKKSLILCAESDEDRKAWVSELHDIHQQVLSV